MNHFRRTASVLKVLLIAPWNLLTRAPQRRAVVRSVLFVIQVLPLPMKPQEWFSRQPVREAVTFPLSQGEGSADIYRIPDGKVRAGVLVFLGIITAPRDDHRVVNLGNALARAGFVAMFPWSSSMMGKRLNPLEPDNQVRGFQHLVGLEYVDPSRAGMGGFCVGASMCLVAASDPRISDTVSFVSSFGCYYDMGDLIKQISTHKSFYGAGAEPWDTNHLSQEVMAYQLINGLEGTERETLSRIFIEEQSAEVPPIDGLSTGGRAVYRLLASAAAPEGQRVSLEEAVGLFQALPSGLREDQRRVSPSAHVDNLKARVLIAHDREDTLVPVEESRRLADALSARKGIHYTEFSFFSHVTPNKKVPPLTFAKEAFKLFRYVYSFIRVAI